VAYAFPSGLPGFAENDSQGKASGRRVQSCHYGIKLFKLTAFALPRGNLQNPYKTKHFATNDAGEFFTITKIQGLLFCFVNQHNNIMIILFDNYSETQ